MAEATAAVKMVEVAEVVVTDRQGDASGRGGDTSL
jgi:hypothetical protein